MKNNRDIDFLFEVGSLRNVLRAWKQVLGVPVENILEHTFRLMLVALIIARKEGNVSEEKIMKMALFHDLAESRTLDAAYIHKEYLDRHEEKAEKDMFSDTSFEGDLKFLEEYHERQSLESKIVRDADHLEVDIELKELEKTGSKTAGKYQKERRIIRDQKLYTNTAKELWDQLQTVDPDNWQLVLTSDWIKSKKFK